MDFFGIKLIDEGVPTGGASGIMNTNDISNKVRGAMPYIIPNSAIRAYAYNALGVPSMTNKDFRPDELDRFREAWYNAQNSRQTDVIPVKANNYSGNVTKTGGNFAPIYNAVVNPERMTLGKFYVTPEGQVVHKLDGRYYEGDVYDFSPNVQTNNKYADWYKALEKFGTDVRQGKAPMIMNINLGKE